MFSILSVCFEAKLSRRRDNLMLYLPSTNMGVSSDMGTLDMKASSFFLTSATAPLLLLSFRAKVAAEFSKEIFLPACSLLCSDRLVYSLEISTDWAVSRSFKIFV